MAHSKFSASASKRWILCPGSIQMCEGKPNPSSPYAEEGTCAHELGEITLLAGGSCSEYLGRESGDAPGWTYSEEMVGYVQQYVDYVNSLLREGDDPELHVEVQVSYAHIVPEGYGTADAVVLVGDTIHVVDLKYGTGLKVSPVENYQLMLYLSGALAQLDPYGDRIKRAFVHIVQPRLDAFEKWEVEI